MIKDLQKMFNLTVLKAAIMLDVIIFLVNYFRKKKTTSY